ncbi:hypothetical protein WJX84_007492 [Apatococcus fuscideae]|uniref:Uncharacterized protein n=1 Tax=Apatococcus fuscideae TaxID=2026836 RepID=A0AAW1TG45_9CHLO
MYSQPYERPMLAPLAPWQPGPTRSLTDTSSRCLKPGFLAAIKILELVSKVSDETHTAVSAALNDGHARVLHAPFLDAAARPPREDPA